VYGLLAVVMATTALVLFTILGLRLLNAYLPGDVWAAYLLLGGLFTLAGMLLWSFRTGKAKE
ncbi:MAG: hypothetical protein ACRD0D_12805, partial [Acidimicrobiales bacterium]